jgi:hypothetical protein
VRFARMISSRPYQQPTCPFQAPQGRVETCVIYSRMWLYRLQLSHVRLIARSQRLWCAVARMISSRPYQQPTCPFQAPQGRVETCGIYSQPHALVEVVCVWGGGVLLTLWRLFAGLRAARKAMGHCISHVFWQTWAFPWRAAVYTNVGAAQTRLAATVGRLTLLPAGLLFFAHVFLNPPAFTG